MQKITFLEDEWSGLRELSMVPRRRAFALELVRREVLQFLMEKAFVEDVDGFVQITGRGLAALKANPPSSPTGVRIWFEPG